MGPAYPRVTPPAVLRPVLPDQPGRGLPDGPAAFLVGILSPSNPEDAYIHFAGVAPQARKTGLARALYERFFDLARADGRLVVRAVTSPANSGSVAFHGALGFSVTGPVTDYDGPGRDLMVFKRNL